MRDAPNHGFANQLPEVSRPRPIGGRWYLLRKRSRERWPRRTLIWPGYTVDDHKEDWRGERVYPPRPLVGWEVWGGEDWVLPKTSDNWKRKESYRRSGFLLSKEIFSFPPNGIVVE